MQYISTRGEAPVLGFSDALLAGLARDGGLYLPVEWPFFSRTDIRSMRGLEFPDLAVRLLTPFLGGEIDEETFGSIVSDAYATFRHQAVCPLIQTRSNEFVLELFHGPTLAFKDVAMQLLARLMDHVLTSRDQRATIAGATSGDTGGAAIDAFAGRQRADIFILFPDGRVSDVQRLQMTTSSESNVHALAIEGNFDDCQALIKDMFNHHDFRDRLSLSGVNSINWARVMAQIISDIIPVVQTIVVVGTANAAFRTAISVGLHKIGGHDPRVDRLLPRLPWRWAWSAWIAVRDWWEENLKSGQATAGKAGALTQLIMTYKLGHSLIGRDRLPFNLPYYALIGEKSERHTLYVAPPRSGKSLQLQTQLAMLPSDGRALVMDPKGHHTNDVLIPLERRCHQLVALDPLGILRRLSQSINLIAQIDFFNQRLGQDMTAVLCNGPRWNHYACSLGFKC